MLKIASFPRSGTHYLCALLKANFYPDEDLSLTVFPWQVGHWSRRAPDLNGEPIILPYGKLFYTHQFPRFWEDNKDVVYIWREGGGVVWSLYRWDQAWHKDKPKPGFSEFLRQPLDWYGSPGIEASGAGDEYRIFDQWLRHIEEAIVRNTFLVSYEKLVANPIRELERIAEHFGLEKPKHWITDVGMVGYCPSSRPNPDLWKAHFGLEDLALYLRYRRRLGECLELNGQ